MDTTLIDRLRQNHAIEHATISVLGRKHDQVGQLGGRASFDGFFIHGPTTIERIEEASREAVTRLAAGEGHLAVSPFCGTNFLIGGASTALVAAVTLGTRNRIGRLPQAIAISALTLIASFRLGAVVQKRWTTKADIGGLEIKNVRRVSGGNRPVHRVYTWIPETVDEPPPTASEDAENPTS